MAPRDWFPATLRGSWSGLVVLGSGRLGGCGDGREDVKIVLKPSPRVLPGCLRKARIRDFGGSDVIVSRVHEGTASAPPRRPSDYVT